MLVIAVATLSGRLSIDTFPSPHKSQQRYYQNLTAGSTCQQDRSHRRRGYSEAERIWNNHFDRWTNCLMTRRRAVIVCRPWEIVLGALERPFGARGAVPLRIANRESCLLDRTVDRDRKRSAKLGRMEAQLIDVQSGTSRRECPNSQHFLKSPVV